MSRTTNIIPNTRFGQITVIEFYKIALIGKKEKRAIYYYKCLCDCGNIKIIPGMTLLKGTCRSCGCFKLKRIKETNSLKKGESSFNRLYADYKRRSEKRFHSFDISKEDFKKITSSNCYYCNKQPNNVTKVKHMNGYYYYNGLDRIDNSKGYTLDNVVPCCDTCNSAKSDYSQKEFYTMVETVYNFRIKKDKT